MVHEVIGVRASLPLLPLRPTCRWQILLGFGLFSPGMQTRHIPFWCLVRREEWEGRIRQHPLLHQAGEHVVNRL